MTTDPRGPSAWLLAGLVLSGLAVAQVWRAGFELMQEFSLPLSFGRDLGGDTSEFFPLGFWPFAFAVGVAIVGFGLLALLVRAAQGHGGARVAAAFAVATVTVAVGVGTWHRIDVDGPRCGVRAYSQATFCMSEARAMLIEGVVPALPGLAAAGLLLFAPPVRRASGASAS